MPDLTRHRPPAAPAAPARGYRGPKPATTITVTAFVLVCLQIGGALTFGWAETVIWWLGFTAAYLLVRLFRTFG